MEGLNFQVRNMGLYKDGAYFRVLLVCWNMGGLIFGGGTLYRGGGVVFFPDSVVCRVRHVSSNERAAVLVS